MTWGQIRLALTKQLPGVDLELLTGWIQASYDVILNERVWAGLSGSGVLVTVAPITAGTVTVTNGSDQVAGAGTAFDFNVAGRLFTVGDDIWYAVLGYADATHLTLDRAFTGPTAATATYRIIQDIYPLAESVTVSRR